MNNNESPRYDSTAETKLRLLKLAEELKSITRACSQMNVGRSTYYQIQKAYEDMGEKGLLPRRPNSIGKPKATSKEQETIILELTKQHPDYSYLKLEEELFNRGYTIRAARIRTIWRKHGLNRASARIDWSHGELTLR